jgi:hypothetical protein
MRHPNAARRKCVRVLLWGAMACALLSGCMSMGDPPAGVCELPYREKRQRCSEDFTKCLDSPLQHIRSDTFGQSLCHVCQDVCMQNNGVWPDGLDDGRACR